MIKTHTTNIFLAFIAFVMMVCSSCDKPSFSSVTGKWSFHGRESTWVLNSENVGESEDRMLCYKDSCYYLLEQKGFEYEGVIKKTKEKHVYDIHFMDGRSERVKIEQFPETNYLFIKPEHDVINHRFVDECSMIYQWYHDIHLTLYIGYGIKELDYMAFIPEHGADTIVSMKIWGTKK